MGYLCELGNGQYVYLENLPNQTLVTIVSGSPGQQQQSSSGFSTGDWTALPEAFRLTSGVVVTLHTAQGKQFIHIHGNSLRVSNEAPSLTEAQPLQVQQTARLPTASMPPMQPMTMGNMQMDREAMSMQMGNMRMSMNSIEPPDANMPQTNASEAAEVKDEQQRQFCSQCGVTIKPSDRFCAHCGHRLG